MFQELCVFKGFSKDEASKGLDALAVLPGKGKTGFAPLTEGMMDRRVEEVLENLFKGNAGEGKALTEGQRIVFLAVYSKERAVAIMRAVKSVSENPKEIIFAMITETALQWTIREYMAHVTEEHEYMKTHDPSKDPDMKPL